MQVDTVDSKCTKILQVDYINEALTVSSLCSLANQISPFKYDTFLFVFSKHVVIHVPYKVKTIHHTHTITKHIHHGGGDKYEVLGYTVGQPISLGHGGGEGGFGGHDFGGSGHDFGGGGGHDFGGGGGGGGGGGHDFGGGSGGHIEISGHGGGGGGGGGGYDFGGGGGFGGDGGFGGGGHEDWSGR